MFATVDFTDEKMSVSDSPISFTKSVIPSAQPVMALTASSTIGSTTLTNSSATSFNTLMSNPKCVTPAHALMLPSTNALT